ncbi:MAG: zinc ribbon domain-containing protein [Prevotellaceae bacterium]|nr:zinc ribbon domain-containing protein [Candidatus Minthosoma equi]
MALIKCPECGKEVSEKASSCPHCGYPLAAYVENLKKGAINPEEIPAAPSTPSTSSTQSTPSTSSTKSTPSVDPAKKKKSGATAAVITLVILILASAAVWFLFFRGGSDEDERTAYENVLRYQTEEKMDSLEEALNDYFDTYNDDAYHYSQLKEILDRFTPENDDWKNVSGMKSAEAVRHFLDVHPDGFFRKKAELRLDSLSFCDAKELNTKESYEQYIDQFPNGIFINEAQKALTNVDKKELEPEEKANVRQVIVEHFTFLGENDKNGVSMTLASHINSYIGKINATEEDIFAFMDKTHSSGRTIDFEVKNVHITKNDMGNGRSSYNVQFDVDENTYTSSVQSSDEGGEQTVKSNVNVKHLQGTGVVNENFKITTLVLGNKPQTEE